MEINSAYYIWRADELARLLQGEWVIPPAEEWYALNFSANAKRIPQDTVFIIINDEKETDDEKNSKLNELILSKQNKICGLIVQKPGLNLSPALPQLIVEDITAAIEKLALSARNNMESKIICVTGTKYKTFTRQLINFVLQLNNSTLTNGPANNKAVDNLLTIASSKHRPDYIILETLYQDMRKNNGNLCYQLTPYICVITDAGITTKDSINPEKSVYNKLKFCQHIKSDGYVILSREMNYYDLVFKELSRMGVKTISYGFAKDCDVKAVSYKVYESGYLINAVVQGKDIEYYLSVYGKAMLECSLAVLALMLVSGMNMEQTEFFSNYSRAQGDRNFDTLSLRKESVFFIDDSRFKSLSSLQNTLNVFKDLEIKENGRKIAILGDILFTEQQTKEQLIEALESFGFSAVLFYGEGMQEIYQQMPEHMEKEIVYKEKECINAVLDNISENDLVFFKGGNLEKIPQKVHKLIINSSRFRFKGIWVIILLAAFLFIRLLYKIR